MSDNTHMSEIRQSFYDIESLNNIFSLCNYKYNDNVIDVYIMADDRLDTQGDSFGRFTITEPITKLITKIIYSKNKNFDGSVRFYDLHQLDANLHLINDFGAKDDTGSFEQLAKKNSRFKMFVNDTDTNYSDKQHSYLMGYNSYNYDTTMLALYINEAFWLKNNTLEFEAPTARTMRDYNNSLFSPDYKKNMPSFLQRGKNGYKNRENIIRLNMLRSGRHIDVAQLNEKMQKIALKRVLGMLGYQILESDKLNNNTATLTTLDELADLIAYNVSDVVNLHELFMHPVYQGNFELKKGLLSTYPELIYKKSNDSYAPDIKPDNVRTDRLYIDSSSAKLAARTLCPYGDLHDIEAVSFLYPSEEKSKELGIPRVNVLEECRKFFYSLFGDKPDICAEFDRIYYFYKNNVEGKNFNDSDEYTAYWSKIRNNNVLPAYSTCELPKQNLMLLYYNKDGSPSNCYVSFGVGGIHGAEYNKALYGKDCAEYQVLYDKHNEICDVFDAVKAQYPDPAMLKEKNPQTKAPWSYEYNGKVYKATDFVKTNKTLKTVEWKPKPEWKKIPPQLFKEKSKGGYELNKKYTFTSAADCNHEDFTSYYPNLLIMMRAFWNDGLGYDRYAEIFENKQKYGKLMKSKNISDEERYHYNILRNGTKLILNSASGAGDVTYHTPIRMNNQIMSMRIIGQLFTFRIGQAQTYEGAKIISTNTDGLYSVCEPVRNAEILAREAANINVEIEPEFCHLVSKDSNNRIEIDKNGGIITASGGSLACYKRPDPTKSLAHAAIIDWAMCEYLRNVDGIHRNVPDFLSIPFDIDKGKVILYNSKFTFSDTAKYLNMFQTVIASSIGSQSYVFGETDNFQGYKHFVTDYPFNADLFNAACESKDINIMSHYNRVFFVKKDLQTIYGKPVYKIKAACSRVVTPAQKLTRKRNDELAIQHDPYAKALLEKYNVFEKDIPDGKEAKIMKITGIDPDWYVYICNKSLFEMDENEKQIIINNLDISNYLTLLEQSFNKNWSNCRLIPKDTSDSDDEAS